MTSVYGVTFIGARDQIRNRIREKYLHVYSDAEIHAISVYLAQNTLSALDQMFTSARKIQDWLADTAKDVARSVPRDEVDRFQRIKDNIKSRQVSAKSKKEALKRKEEAAPLNHSSSVMWTTPLGLTVVQPYKKRKTTVVSTSLQDFTIPNPFAKCAVDIQKQKAGFPPNFIHSLDATHMLMTALACTYPTTDQLVKDIGPDSDKTTLANDSSKFEPLTFASVHDSYWTHARDVPRLRTILKEQFVKLHSQPILEKLRNELTERYKDRLVLNVYTQEEYQERQKGMDAQLLVADGAAAKELDGAKDAEAADTLQSDDASDDDAAQEAEQPEKAKKTAGAAKTIRVWEPLVIAPVPQKGDFDVRVVQQSEYFFS